MKIEFFLTQDAHGYRLVDANGDDHTPVRFATEASAADAAIRTAQDMGALYAIYY